MDELCFYLPLFTFLLISSSKFDVTLIIVEPCLFFFYFSDALTRLIHLIISICKLRDSKGLMFKDIIRFYIVEIVLCVL